MVKYFLTSSIFSLLLSKPWALIGGAFGHFWAGAGSGVGIGFGLTKQSPN